MSLTIKKLGTEHVFSGQWITDKRIQIDKKRSPEPITVRKAFSITRKPARAVLYATAVGNYFVTVNGQKITDEMLAPGYTSYKKVLQYQAYDITDRLKEQNELLAVVSGGWAVGQFGFTGAARRLRRGSFSDVTLYWSTPIEAARRSLPMKVGR